MLKYLSLIICTITLLQADEFYIGMYAVERQNDKTYTILKDIGINYVHSYSAYNKAPHTEILDMASKYDMKVLYDIRSRNRLPTEDPEWKNKLETLVKTVKDHPALGMWVAYSEPAAEDMPRVREIVEMIKSHSTIPSALIIHWRANWEKTRDYADVWMADHYPVRGQAFPEAPLENISRFFGKAARMRVPGTPFIPILQACDFSCFPKNVLEENRKTLRYPNHTESRYMALSVITYGSRGIFYFALSHCHLDRPQGKAFFKDSLAPTLKEVKAFTGQVQNTWEVTAYCYDFNMRHGVNFAYWARPNGNFIILTHESRQTRDLELPLKIPGAPQNGILIPWGSTAEKAATLQDGILTVKDAAPWESFIWQVK